MRAASGRLQVGGTLVPDRDLYIPRPEDKELIAALGEHEYVNIVSSRQVGKSSLMVHAAVRMQAQGWRLAVVDLTKLGSPPDADGYFQGLVNELVEELELKLDVPTFWGDHAGDTASQRLIRFFRDVVLPEIPGSVAVFLDEIDSTLKFPYTDDLFTALRAIYNDRALAKAYRRLVFCLVGVATPNELIKSRRTTPYNVGRTIWVGDFDPSRDNLGPLAGALHNNGAAAQSLLDRILYWTSGHPFLTVRLVREAREASVAEPADIDRLVQYAFAKLDRLGEDVHVQSILRFVAERLTDGGATLRLYESILNGAKEPDQSTLIHTELKLSGLVGRDLDGRLISRNRIYAKLFDITWVYASRGLKAPSRIARLQIGGTLVPDRSLYIPRPEDEELNSALSERDYVNVVAKRQAGKSSLMVRAALRLQAQGWRFAVVDLTGLGAPPDADAYFQGLIKALAAGLKLKLDVPAFWDNLAGATASQRLVAFFHDLVLTQIKGPVAIFLDEIDSTLKLPYTDDLFTALRAIYNERTLVEAYRRLAFCLVGVATPDELVKNPHNTPYNVGHTIWVGDFDPARDDLKPLADVLHANSVIALPLLARILYWTGGHPFLTVRLVKEAREAGVAEPAQIDGLVERTFATLKRLPDDLNVHFQSIQRFVDERLTDSGATLRLYERILGGATEPDKPGLSHAELKLSGLVQRDLDGRLAIRNRIYACVFDRAWVRALQPVRKTRRIVAMAVCLVLLLTLGSLIAMRLAS